MSDYRNAFEQLAERGPHLGATALLERLEHEPQESYAPRPAAWWRGPALAAAAFIALLALGILTTLALRPEPDVVEPDNFQLLKGDATLAGGTAKISTGPGGFLSPTRQSFEFSADGIDWTPVEMPRTVVDDRPQRNVLPVRVVANDVAWLASVHQNQRQRAWVSTNGQVWIPIDLNDEIQGSVTVLAASGQLFAIESIDEDGTERFWLSSDGVEWAEADVPGQHMLVLAVQGSARGLMFWVIEQDQTLGARITTDGVSWTTASFELTTGADDGYKALPHHFFAVRDGWVVTSQEETTVGRRVHVWTSRDLSTWDYQGTPEFLQSDGHYMIPVEHQEEMILVRTAELLPGEGRTDPPTFTELGAIWRSADGIDWELVAEGLDGLGSAAGRYTTEGTFTIVWSD